MGHGPCSHENYDISGAQGFGSPESNSDSTAMGEVECAPDGVFDHGTHEEDGPGPWDCLEPPRTKSGTTGIRSKLSDAQHAGGRACCRLRRSVRIRGRSIARDDRSDGRWVEGAGGLRSSVDAGERVALDPVEQLRPVLV